MSLIDLREYQSRACFEVEKARQDGCKGILIQLATGGGKTVIFSQLAKDWVDMGLRVAITNHREELIEQSGKTIERLGIWHGVIKAGVKPTPLAPIQVCSIDSMRNRELPWQPDIIIIDEAHLINAERFNNFLAKYPEAFILAVTATPWRLDGKGFNDYADRLYIAADIKDLIAQGYLVTPRCISGGDHSNLLSGIGHKGKEFNQTQMNRVYSERSIIGDVVEQYRKHANGRKGIVFCSGIENSKQVCAEFNAAGIPAEHIDGDTPTPFRRGTLAKLRSGEIRIVTNDSVLCEGYDDPSIDYVGLVRMTESLSLYLQMAGRGLRPHPGKKDCIILDHGQNVGRFGHVLEDRRWSLDGKVDIDEKPAFKECPTCSEWVPVKAKQCPACGFQFGGSSRPRKELEVVQAELQEIKPKSFLERNYAALLRMAAKKGHKPGWAYFRLREKAMEDGITHEAFNQEVTYSLSARYQREFYQPLLATEGN